MALHPLPTQSTPSKVALLDCSKVRVQPIRRVVTDPNKLQQPAPQR